MARGAPDYYQYILEGKRHVLADMAELAARLNSPVAYDRRGQVIWFNDFRHGLGAWYYDGSGTGNEAVLAVDPTFRSPYSAKLIGGTTSYRYATIEKALGAIELNKLGVEVALNLLVDTNYVDFDIEYHTGSDHKQGSIRLNTLDETISYLDSDGNWQTIVSSASLVDVSHQFDHYKLVVDGDENEYLRFLANEVEYDLSGIALKQRGAYANNTAIVRVTSYGAADYNSFCYVGHVIATCGEP